jgi:hypothetical protein
MEYISLSCIRYSRAWGSYQDFVYKGLLLTRKLLNKGFLLVKLKSSLRKFYGLCWPLWNIWFTNDHGYFALVANTSRPFPHAWLIIGFVTRLTLWVPLVEQELLTLPEHLSFSGVRVTRCLVVCVCFVELCLSFCTFLLAVVLSVILRYTDYNYPFVIFKLFIKVIPETYRVE